MDAPSLRLPMSHPLSGRWCHPTTHLADGGHFPRAIAHLRYSDTPPRSPYWPVNIASSNYPLNAKKFRGHLNKIEKLPTKDEKEEKPSKDEMPEFMTAAMREKISRTVLRKEHEEKVKSMLEASETACDDTHKFNPSRFDMENAMRINLKKDCEPPPPEFWWNTPTSRETGLLCNRSRKRSTTTRSAGFRSQPAARSGRTHRHPLSFRN